jgi:uncharacterized protein YjdB
MLLMIQIVPGNSQTKILIDHHAANLWDISPARIDSAQSKLHIAYQHTSHGMQLTSGMQVIYGKFGSAYAYNVGGSDGALDLRDYFSSGDLGNPDFTSWADLTRSYLLNHPEINVMIWAWCGQLSWASETEVNTYLDLMDQLESEFQNVQFVYMTGHLDGTGSSGNLNLRNNQIRDFCVTHHKILYDFADIESYDPDAVTNYMTLNANDNCDYDSDGNGSLDANWAVQWAQLHPDSCYYFGECAHSQALNCQKKGISAWFLWAMLADDSAPVSVPVASITINSPGNITHLNTNGDTLQLSVTVKPDNASNKDVTWSVVSNGGQASIDAGGLVTAEAGGKVTIMATARDGSGVSGTLQLTITDQWIPVTSVRIYSADGADQIVLPSKTLQLFVEVLPEEASDKTVSWSIRNTRGMAQIDTNGLVTAILEGPVYALAKANGDVVIMDSFKISILQETIWVTDIEITTAAGVTTLKGPGDSLQLYALVLPESASDPRVAWSVINQTGQAGISASGMLHAILPGSIRARAAAMDGSGILGELDLEIQHPSGLEINEQLGIIMFCQDRNHLCIKDQSGISIGKITLLSASGIPVLNQICPDNVIIIDVSSLQSQVYILLLERMKTTVFKYVRL